MVENPMVLGQLGERQEATGVDHFGNEVYPGDVILVLDDEFFFKEELSEETVAVLELAGAYETTAQ